MYSITIIFPGKCFFVFFFLKNLRRYKGPFARTSRSLVTHICDQRSIHLYASIFVCFVYIFTHPSSHTTQIWWKYPGVSNSGSHPWPLRFLSVPSLWSQLPHHPTSSFSEIPPISSLLTPFLLKFPIWVLFVLVWFLRFCLNSWSSLMDSLLSLNCISLWIFRLSGLVWLA